MGFRSIFQCFTKTTPVICLAFWMMPLSAQFNLGPITVGAGLRTSYVHTDVDGAESTDKFNLDNIRLYVSGPVTEDKKISFMFNTDYNSIDNHIGVLDAVGRFELSPMFNVWA